MIYDYEREYICTKGCKNCKSVIVIKDSAHNKFIEVCSIDDEKIREEHNGKMDFCKR